MILDFAKLRVCTQQHREEEFILAYTSRGPGSLWPDRWLCCIHSREVDELVPSESFSFPFLCKLESQPRGWCLTSHTSSSLMLVIPSPDRLPINSNHQSFLLPLVVHVKEDELPEEDSSFSFRQVFSTMTPLRFLNRMIHCHRASCALLSILYL